MKIVGVTPAGRRRYLEVLVPYLLRARDVLDEHHLWLNTNDPADIRYIKGLAAEHPDFFKLNSRHGGAHHGTTRNIGSFWQDCTADDTVYVRVDDDVCYAAPDAISKLASFRVAHPEPFLVFGNIVNNSVCAHFQQRQGRIPLEWGAVELDSADELGWASRRFARRLHEHFLADLEAGRESDWTKTDFSAWHGTDRFSINAIAWLGHDVRGLGDLFDGTYFEEAYVTEVLPAQLGRPTRICGEALFGHFSFYTQRRYLDCFPSLLARYRAIAAGEPPPRRSRIGRAWEEARGALDRKLHPREPGAVVSAARLAMAEQNAPRSTHDPAKGTGGRSTS